MINSLLYCDSVRDHQDLTLDLTLFYLELQVDMDQNTTKEVREKEKLLCES